jgi:hypothetical protein
MYYARGVGVFVVLRRKRSRAATRWASKACAEISKGEDLDVSHLRAAEMFGCVVVSA